MKLITEFRKGIIAAVILLGTNVVTGMVAAAYVRNRDFSESNLNCLLNWGNINAQFEHAHAQKSSHFFPEDEAQVYRTHESNARFLVHYPKFTHRMGMDQDKSLTLFCWAVAAENYHDYNVDIPVDPLVWKAFLSDGPKDLPLYWQLLGSLTHEGAGQGLIRGGNTPPRIGSRNAYSLQDAAFVHALPSASRRGNAFIMSPSKFPASGIMAGDSALGESNDNYLEPAGNQA